MQTVKILSITEHRGSPRVWFQGHAPAKAGFAPGARFDIAPHPNKDKEGLVIRLAADGKRTVSRKVYASGAEVPVMDINSADDLALFEGCEAIRVVFGEGEVYLSPVASEQRRAKRLARLRQRVQAGEALTTAGVCAGGGILSHAVHAGFRDAGLATQLAAHNEIREDLANHAVEHNDVFSSQTMVLNMPLQELAFDEAVLRRVGEVDVVELGLPCSGASKAGRAKRKTGFPEEHPDVGHLVVAALALLAKLNPVACVFENVPAYATTASAVLIRQQLRDMGYVTQEIELFGPDFGELEARKRWCLVAVTKGIPFDLTTLMPGPFAVRQLKDVLDAPDAENVVDRWNTMEGLKAKAVRDKEAGHNFKMQVYTGAETSINTLTKGISKNRSTDPKIQHPDNPDLLRIPTAQEHARCKGVPEHLIEGLSHTVAHELLGQGIVYRPFRLLARHLAAALKQFAMAQTWSANNSRIGAMRAAA